MPLPSGRVVPAGRTAAARAVAEATMPTLATQKRRTGAKTAGGGDSTTVATVASNVPCRLSARDSRPDEPEIAARAEGRQLWTVAVPVGTDVQADRDLFVIGTRTFEVLGTDKDAAYAPELRCTCAEVG